MPCRLIGSGTGEKVAPQLRRSSIKTLASRSRAKARRVRFRGVPSDALLQFVGFLIQHFRPGSSTLQLWDRFIAIAVTVDFFIIPLVSVVSTVRNDQAVVQHVSLKNYLGYRLRVSTVCMDVLFLLHILVQFAQVRSWNSDLPKSTSAILFTKLCSYTLHSCYLLVIASSPHGLVY